jgi:transposase
MRMGPGLRACEKILRDGGEGLWIVIHWADRFGGQAMTGGARVVKADRSQLSWDLVDLEGWLPADHRARVVWAFAETLDLSSLYAAVKSREGEAGRPTSDPRVHLALWLYATIDAVGSARELDRLSRGDLAYRWLRGGVPLDYHTLSDFRRNSGDLLDRLLGESLTALMAEGLVRLDEVIIDGTKVRAAASKGSFKTAAGLAEMARLAEERVATLKAETDADPAANLRRRKAARERAAREVGERATRAKAMLDKLAAEKEARTKTHKAEEAGKAEPSASATDPEARMMRFADGAVRPGYNMQVAATADCGLILAIDPTDRRNDSGLARPMVKDIERRLGVVPGRIIVDTVYATAGTSWRWLSLPGRSPRSRRPSPTGWMCRPMPCACGQPNGPASRPRCATGAPAWQRPKARRPCARGSASSSSMRRSRTEVLVASSCAGWPRSEPWRCCTPSPTT